LKLQPDDRLNIWVSSPQKPSLAVPFNLGIEGYEVDTRGRIGTVSTEQESGYRVDRDGYIDFPVLGKVHVEGLTTQELSDRIKETLKQRRLISDALVSVTLLNFKVLIFGEVGGVGILSVPGDKLTLIEAIARSGGLGRNAKMDEVWVIREEENGRRAMVVDLRTVSMFNSPGFYLQQNDIVYVKPKVAPRTALEDRLWQVASMFLGAGGTVISLIILFRTYGN